MTTATRPNRPTHRVYAVSRGAEGEKSQWMEIGAAWPHKDGQGFAVKLNRAAVDPNAEIVIRTPRTKGGAS